MLSRLEEHYGVRPVLYATKAAYDRYLAEDYADYPLWIRSIAGQPALSDGRAWTFWQYTSRMRLPRLHRAGAIYRYECVCRLAGGV